VDGGGLGLFVAILALRKRGVGVSSATLHVATVGIGLAVLPRLPGIGEQVNGAAPTFASGASPSSLRVRESRS
jgi:hypothetical protein